MVCAVGLLLLSVSVFHSFIHLQIHIASLQGNHSAALPTSIIIYFCFSSLSSHSSFHRD